MKRAAIFMVALFVAGNVLAADASKPAPKILPRVNPLPTALNEDFQFRKTKLFLLSANPPKAKKSLSQSLASRNPNNPTTGIAEASLGFERTYRLYGAITNADRNQRYGNYLDFFWRVKRPANVTVRLEYRQGEIPSFVPARGNFYPQAKDNKKNQVNIIRDEYFQE